MDRLSTAGRIFFASYGVVLGVQNFIYGTFIATLMPVPKWMASNAAMALIIGGVVVLISLALALSMKGQFAATLLAIFYFLTVLVLHLPKLITNIYDAGEWTVVAELVALCSGAVIAATLLPTDIREWYGLPDRRNSIRRIAALVFAATLGAFAWLHFKYAEFISFLIPEWIPFRVFWAYFVGAAFLAAVIAIVLRIRERLALYLLGTMFFIWVLIEHAPRVWAHPGRDEWSSTFIALAMCGISIQLAAARRLS